MKTLVITLLFISMGHAGTPPNCAEIGRTLSNFEMNLETAHVDKCGDLNLASLNPGTSEAETETFQNHKCSDLKTIEATIQRLENEKAVRSAFDKLLFDLQRAKAQVSDQNLIEAAQAGTTFMSGLNTAQSFELLLNTSRNGRPLLQILQEAGESVVDLPSKIREICGSESSIEDACNPALFKPTELSKTEIMNLLMGSGVVITPEKINSWREALAIQKKSSPGEPYSFVKMQTELPEALIGALSQIDQGSSLSKEQIRAIQALDDFEKRSQGTLPFTDYLFKNKGILDQKVLTNRFVLHMLDAKKRHELEVQARISSAWQLLVERSNGTLASTDCDSVKNSFEKVQVCLNFMKTSASALPDTSNDFKSNFLERIAPAMETSINYIMGLENNTNRCRDLFSGIEGKDLATVSGCFDVVSSDQASLGAQIRQLNLLKDNIAVKNQGLIAMRNFALEKWRTQNCTTEASPMDLCEAWTSADGTEHGVSIPPEVYRVADDSMKIMLTFAPDSEAEAKAQALCEDEERKPLPSEGKLCAFFDDTTDYDTEAPNTHQDGPLSAPDGNHAGAAARDAWIATGANLLGDTLRALMPQPPAPPRVNPYQYNFTPHNGGRPPLGIADSIMFNARFHGAYGLYMPTPGTRPGTVLGSSIRSPSHPNSGKYFNF